jgi:prophage regulatory protein
MDYLAHGFLRLKHIIGDQSKSPEVPGLIPISRSSWWAGVKAGRYPQPIKLSARITVWRTKDILALIQGD